MTKEELQKAIDDAKAAQKALDEALAKQKQVEDDAQAKTVLPAEGQKSFKAPVGRTSDEEKTLRYFGVKHPSQLIHVNTADAKFRHVPAKYRQTAMALKNAVDDSRFIAQLFMGDAKDHIGKKESQDRIANVKGILESAYAKDELVPRLKAFGTGVVGAGAEWVPQLISSQYIEEYELERVVSSLFRDVPMPSAVYDLPVQTNPTKARQVTQGGTITPTQFGTDGIRFESRKLGEYFELPDELDQDSAPPIFALARQELMKAQQRAVEYMTIRGSRAVSHYDSDLAAADADIAEKTVDGLVRLALANSANGSTTNFGGAIVSEANLRKIRGSLGKFGVAPKELAWIIGPQVQSQFLALPSVVTLDKMGPLATVLTGQIGSYQGIPIIVSEAMREDLNATGVYNGSVTNLAGLLLVNTTRAYNGIRRAIKMKLQESNPNSDIWWMASYQRRDFKTHDQGPKEVSVAYGYNIAL